MKKAIALLLLTTILSLCFVGCNNTPSNSNEETQTTPNEEVIEPQPNPALDFEYEENNAGGITITRYIGQDLDIIIPEKIQNKLVTEIGNLAFITDYTLGYPLSNKVRSVKMPNTVTKIGLSAFMNCDALESIILSENLTTIDAFAFQNCVNLKHITIPAKVTMIGDQAFDASGLETLTLEEGITALHGYRCFAGTQLKQITLPSTIEEIGILAFATSPNLESIMLNEGLVKIGHMAFANNLELKEIVIPKTVEVITEMDFDQCSGLEKIKFEGNAPATFEYSDSVMGVWEPYYVHFTVCYHEGAEGFTSPEWYGYPTEIW